MTTEVFVNMTTEIFVCMKTKVFVYMTTEVIAYLTTKVSVYLTTEVCFYCNSDSVCLFVNLFVCLPECQPLAVYTGHQLFHQYDADIVKGQTGVGQLQEMGDQDVLQQTSKIYVKVI